MSEKIKTNSDSGFLKLIGIIAMTCDHVGKMLLPNLMVLQLIGRIAFPIFAYCIVVGSLYTKGIWNYWLRLTVLAIIFQLGYTFYCYPNWTDTFLLLNIFFTLSIGLLCIIGFEQKKWWLAGFGIILAYFLNIDYGLSGVLLIIAFYLLRNYPIFSALVVAFILVFMLNTPIFPLSWSISSFSILSLPLIYIKTSFNLKINKYVFYLFYPLHFCILYLIQLILNK